MSSAVICRILICENPLPFPGVLFPPATGADNPACVQLSSSKAGKYSKNLKLSNPKDDTAYKIKVTTETESGIIEQTASVVYSEQSPVLEELKLYYWGHDSSMNYYNRVFDLTDKTQLQNTITFNPNYEYTFTVKMSKQGKN